jgi:hypothetical protein
MNRRAATVAAAGLTLVAYVGIAWMVSGIAIPDEVPTAQTPWLRPFRVVATLGFALASWVHVPHVAGQLLAAIVLGAVLGAIFSTTRHLLE